MIAGTLAVSGAAFDLLALWDDGEFELIVSPQLIFEVRKSLLHPRIAGKYGISSDEVEELARRLSEEGLLFDDPMEPPRVVPDDPGDDYLVALALAADSDLLITRDHHFDEVRVEGLLIVAPRQALRWLRRNPS